MNGLNAPANTGTASDPHAELLGKPIGTTASKSTKPIEEDEGDSDEEPEPAASLPEPEPAVAHETIATDLGHRTEEDAEHPPLVDVEPLSAPHDHEHADVEHAHVEPVDVGHPAETHPLEQAPVEAPVADEPPPVETMLHLDGEPHEAAAPVDASAHEHDHAPVEGLDPDPQQDHAPEHGAVHAAEHLPAVQEDATAEVFHGWASGYKPMEPRPGAAQYQPSIAVKFGRLPAKVDLRPLLSPIEDQGEIRSCVASAVAAAYEAWLRKTHKQDDPASRLFIYYNARWRDGTQEEDEGSAIQLAMEGLCRFGACSEAFWPFDPHLALKKPGAAAYEAAAAYRVADIARVPLKLEAWKQALAEGKPIVFGCELFETFDHCSRLGGVVPMPELHDVAHAGHSGHAMCAVGYSDIEKVFIVRNSWSAHWGDAGYCYMPYAYLLSPTFNDGDCWVFVPKIPAQPPRETWSDATSPVTNGGAGVDFPIETRTARDYEALGIDLFARGRHPYNASTPQDYAAYVSAVGQGRWGDLESFDVSTYLAVAAALTDVDLLGGEPDSAEGADAGGHEAEALRGQG
jgi:hypothetical protein